MSPDQEYQVLAIAFSCFNYFYELGRVHAAAGRIEEDLPRAWVLRKQIEPLRHDLAHTAVGVTRGPFQKLGGNRIRVRVARLPDVVNEDSHASYSTAKY